MTLPPYDQFMLPLLKLVGDRQGYSIAAHKKAPLSIKVDTRAALSYETKIKTSVMLQMQARLGKARIHSN